MPLPNYLTTQKLFPQFTWQLTWETLLVGFATMTCALWQGAQAVFNTPEESFFMQAMEDEHYQVYSQGCSEVRRAERSLLRQLERKQLSPFMLQNALLTPLANLSFALISPLYYYLRLKKLELTLTEKNYPPAFKESVQGVGYRLKGLLKENPELTRNYFYQDIINHLIELSAQRFSASKLLGWIKFYEGLVEESLYQSVNQALNDFIEAHHTDEIAARHYKTLIAQLNKSFQKMSEEKNSVEASSSDQSTTLNLRFLALTSLALVGGHVAQQMHSSYIIEKGLTQINWQSIGIMSTCLGAWSMLSHGSLSYSHSYLMSLPALAGSLSTLFPLTTGQIILNGTTLEISSLNGTYGFSIDGVNNGDQTGFSIASGDINADGITDVLIGSQSTNASYVVFGHSGLYTAVIELSTLNGTNGFIISNGYGYSIASGDINADGIADVLLGSPYASPSGRSFAGASYVVFGHTGTFSSVLDLSTLNGANGFVIYGKNENEWSGFSIASGDINADNITDVLIGAPAIYGYTACVGYVMFGNTGPFSAMFDLSTINGTNGFVINGTNVYDQLGSSIASGDINVDGIADVLIGAPFASPSGRNGAGVSYVVFGHTGPFSAEFKVSTLDGANGIALNGVNANDWSGSSIASGDINGDSIVDVLIGAYSAHPNNKTQAGASYVVFGHPGSFPQTFELSTLNGVNGFVMNGVLDYDRSGASIASGDINADGKADVLIGAYGAKGYTGASYVVYGHTGSFPSALNLSTLNGSNGFTMNGEKMNDYFGRSIASGDINADGVVDVLIGTSPYGSFNTTGPGTSYAVFGSNVTVFIGPSPSNSPSPNFTPSNTPSSSSAANNKPGSNNTSSGISTKTKIAIGVSVSLAAVGLFAVSSIVGYKRYQRRKADRSDIEIRGSHLSNKDRRSIGQFVLINDLDAKEAQSLYEQTGIWIAIPEGGQHQKVLLGGGKFGKVKLAYDQKTHEYVAVKKIKGVRAMKDSEQERLIHERLNGLPHILPLLHSEITEDSRQKPAFYQFTRLAGFGNGKRLGQQLAQVTDEELKWKLIQHVVQGLLTGIASMHAKNTYHLDIKPQNYMLTISGMVYVIDFGCTREFKPGEVCWIEDGAMGDINCLSPERWANFRYCLQTKGQAIGPATEVVERYDAEKADAWSVGLALLELILGRYPLNDDNVGFISRLNQWDSNYLNQLLETAFADVASKVLNQRGQSLIEIIKDLLTIDQAQRLTVIQAIKHPLFEEIEFNANELSAQFRALNELGLKDKTINNSEITRRDISLYSTTTTSHKDDPNYGSVHSMALKA